MTKYFVFRSVCIDKTEPVVGWRLFRHSNPIKGLDETIRTKLHNVFMSRLSVFHAPVHSTAFAMDRQFCWRDMDDGVKKDIWSVMEDFSKSPGPGGKDLSKMKDQYEMLVDDVVSKQVTV